MKLKKMLALTMAAVLAAGLTACGSSADTSAAPAAESTEAAGAPDGDGDPTTLTVAMECAYAPYNWTQSDDSNGAVAIRGSSDYAYGYDVMMAKKIGEALGQQVQIVKLDWDSLIPAVMSGCTGRFQQPLLLRLDRHPNEEGQRLRQCGERGRSGRCDRYQPAGHHLV